MSEKRGLPASVAAPADKRFRRADTRPGRKGGRWYRSPWLRWGLAAALVLGLTGYGLTAVVRAKAFAISRIVVRGNSHLSTGEVLAIVDGLRGGSLFQADLTAYRAKLLDSPWVTDATFRRVLPATIEVRIAERVPMAIGRLGDQLYLVDPTGLIIDEFGPQYAQYDLPIVDGLVSAPTASTPVVDPERARLAARFLDALAGAPALKPRVSQVDVSNAHNLVVLLDQDPARLYVGDKDFIARLQRYVEMGATLQEQIKDIDYVDLRFDERIPVSRKRAATSAGAGAPAAAKGKS